MPSPDLPAVFVGVWERQESVVDVGCVEWVGVDLVEHGTAVVDTGRAVVPPVVMTIR